MVTMFSERKSTYKVPPTTITDRLVSQEARRAKALEDQKRRRAERIDSSRNLDQFADLSLGGDSDEEVEDAPSQLPAPLGVAHFAGLLSQQESPTSHPPPTSPAQTRVAGKKNNRRKRKKNKPSKWADKCMYAELLEMDSDLPWSDDTSGADGLPGDLEEGWVAVAPVPVGKRCLAVTHQSSGVVGVAPNTTLRSRLLGKVLIQRFPSVFPPMTILDCILDTNWRENGILHILDVIKWKGQDISDCEASFRDTRLTELSQGAPAAISFLSNPSQITTGGSMTSQGHHYRFTYPNSFIPVPYTTNTDLNTLYHNIIPTARSTRSIPISIPTAPPTKTTAEADEGGMDVDSTAKGLSGLPSAPMETQQAVVASDGLLLYVKEASYEPGTSPLSSWIPITHPEGGHEPEGQPKAGDPGEPPLDHFARLVARRIATRGQGPTSVEVEM